MDLSKMIEEAREEEGKQTTHVDDFIDHSFKKSDAENYARWFLFLHRLPAEMQMSFKKWISQYELYCTFEGIRYRVTGASRMGDIWLTRDFKQHTGYQRRVMLDDCSEWSDKPEVTT